MKATLFSRVSYMGPAPTGRWPVTPAACAPDAAMASMDAALEQFELADQLGFDWITLAEHHYAPLSLTPNPMVMAAAVSQRVRRARIAVLGANLPSLNPVRVRPRSWPSSRCSRAAGSWRACSAARPPST